MLDPVYEGDLTLQKPVIITSHAPHSERDIQRRIPAGAINFISAQHTMALCWLTGDGSVQTRYLTGPQGFITATGTGRQLTISLSGKEHLPHLLTGDSVGGMLLDCSGQRRLRLSGIVQNIDQSRLVINIENAATNRSKYVQTHSVEPGPEPDGLPYFETGTFLDNGISRWIKKADTFFVISQQSCKITRVPRTCMSHRGGESGFVKLDRQRLTIPDYPGNEPTGTLDNYQANPLGTLLFTDFGGNQQLQLHGAVSLDLEPSQQVQDLNAQDRNEQDETSTGPVWHFDVATWTIEPLAFPLQNGVS